MNLFRTADAKWVTPDDLRRALDAVHASDCELLYIHSEISFGVPNPELRRRDLLAAIFEALKATGVPTLVVPTFTFSFCNGEPFDPARSRSAMGALNEYIRTTGEAERSRDPLLSVAIVGDEKSIGRDLPPASLGRGSTFDRIHGLGAKARFLFLGVDPAKCFTYTHYVEKCLGVPYRYDRAFDGTIIDGDREQQTRWTLYVRYCGVEPTRSSKFADFLRSRGVLEQARCGDSLVASISEPDAYAAVADRLERDIDYFLASPYPRDRRDTSFEAHNMVAL